MSSAWRDEALAAADLIQALFPLGQRRASSALSFYLIVLSFLCPARQLPTSDEPCTPSSICPRHLDTTISHPLQFFCLIPPSASSLPSPLCFKHGLLRRNNLSPARTSRPQEQPRSLWSQRTVPSGSDVGQGALCCGQTGSSYQHWATGCCQDDWQDKTWCYGNKPPLTGSEVKDENLRGWEEKIKKG